MAFESFESMAGKQRYTCNEVKGALAACNGLVYLAADRLGCTSATIINYMHRYPSIRQAVLERRGRRVDVAEAALDKAVLDGEAWAVQFLLRTQARDRGYAEGAGAEGAALAVLAAFERLARGGPDLPAPADEVRLRITRVLDDAPGPAEPDGGPAAAGEDPLAARDAL